MNNVYDKAWELALEFGSDNIDISRAYHCHDEDEWNKYIISYKGIIIGSELVGLEFMRHNILRVIKQCLA